MNKLKYHRNIESIYEQLLKIYNAWSADEMKEFVHAIEYLLVVNDRFSKYGTRVKPSKETMVRVFSHYQYIIRRNYDIPHDTPYEQVVEILRSKGYYLNEYRCAEFYMHEFQTNERFVNALPDKILSYSDSRTRTLLSQ